MRKFGLAAVASALVVFGALWGYPRLFAHRLQLQVYFQNVQGLRAGAPVRLAGVDVGEVTSVRVRPEKQAAPVEVTMSLRTPYELNIPNDSTVSLDTAGVLGETYAEIKVLGASGAPIKSNGVLKEKPTKILSTEDIIQKLGEIVQPRPCTPQGKDIATAVTPETKLKNHQ